MKHHKDKNQQIRNKKLTEEQKQQMKEHNERQLAALTSAKAVEEKHVKTRELELGMISDYIDLNDFTKDPDEFLKAHKDYKEYETLKNEVGAHNNLLNSQQSKAKAQANMQTYETQINTVKEHLQERPEVKKE